VSQLCPCFLNHDSMLHQFRRLVSKDVTVSNTKIPFADSLTFFESCSIFNTQNRRPPYWPVACHATLHFTDGMDNLLAESGTSSTRMKGLAAEHRPQIHYGMLDGDKRTQKSVPRPRRAHVLLPQVCVYQNNVRRAIHLTKSK